MPQCNDQADFERVLFTNFALSFKKFQFVFKHGNLSYSIQNGKSNQIGRKFEQYPIKMEYCSYETFKKPQIYRKLE